MTSAVPPLSFAHTLIIWQTKTQLTVWLSNIAHTHKKCSPARPHYHARRHETSTYIFMPTVKF